MAGLKSTRWLPTTLTCLSFFIILWKCCQRMKKFLLNCELATRDGTTLLTLLKAVTTKSITGSEDQTPGSKNTDDDDYDCVCVCASCTSSRAHAVLLNISVFTIVSRMRTLERFIRDLVNYKCLLLSNSIESGHSSKSIFQHIHEV